VSGSVDGDINTLPSGSVPLTGPLPSRIIAVPTFRERVAAPIAAAFEKVCGVLADDVGVPVDAGASPFATDPDTATAWLLVQAPELAQSLEWAEGRDDELDPGMLVLVTLGRNVSLSQYLASQRVRYEASAQLDAVLGDDTVMVTPTINATSWPADGPMPSEIDGHHIGALSAVNTMDLNLTGHPAVAVPMGVSPEGVPMSLQVIAPRFRDDLAISVSAAIEQAMPWPLTAPGYDPFPTP
jgi:aspartyl-tRNA(Asn)/glutamyl-tRNA(Gln) amidotransferase subunit A